MSDDEPVPPVAEDDFPEFSEPPRQKPSRDVLEGRAPQADTDDSQSQVDDVIARLRREREQGER